MATKKAVVPAPVVEEVKLPVWHPDRVQERFTDTHSGKDDAIFLAACFRKAAAKMTTEGLSPSRALEACAEEIEAYFDMDASEPAQSVGLPSQHT